MTKQLIIFLLIGIFTNLLANIGNIISLKGDVNIKRDNKVTKAVKNQDIKVRDTILTIGVAKVKIKFKDGTIIHLGKDAVFSIADYYYTENQKPTARFSMLNGAFQTLSGKIGKIAPSKFKIKTNTSTIGIRGTAIIGLVTPKGDKIGCTSGAISVSTPQGTVDVKAGKFTDVKPKQAPKPPKKITKKFIEKIKNDTLVDKDDEITKTLDKVLADNILEDEKTFEDEKTETVNTNSTKNKDITDSDNYNSWGYWKRSMNSNETK